MNELNLLACLSSLSPREFLESKSCGAYTVIPLTSYGALDLPFHTFRLYESFMSVFPSRNDCIASFAYSLLRSLTLPGIIIDANSPNQRSIVTILAGVNNVDGLELHCQSNSFDLMLGAPIQDSKSTAVDIQAYTRSYPKVKVSSWPTERKSIERLRPITCSETIMARYETLNDKVIGMYDLTEGLTSNLFITRENQLITAPDDLVLEGSMARLVKRAAAHIGVLTSTEKLSLSKARSWSGAFLTSKTVLCIAQCLPIVSIV